MAAEVQLDGAIGSQSAGRQDVRPLPPVAIPAILAFDRVIRRLGDRTHYHHARGPDWQVSLSADTGHQLATHAHRSLLVSVSFTKRMIPDP